MVSIKEVAIRAGVSISTVSNVINGTRYVSDELVQKVNQAIEELDYEVDLLARSLKNNRTMLIGVIITSLNRIFIPQVLNGLQKSAEEHGYHLLIHATNDDIKMEKKYLQYPLSSITLMSKENLTVAMTLSKFKGLYSSNYALMSAGAMILTIPQIIFFTCFQKQIVGGMTSGAVKG